MDEYSNMPRPGGVATEPQPEQAPDEQQRYEAALDVLTKQVKSGGNWFYWIAGLSMINTIIAVFNGEWHFVVGLGFTQIIDYFIHEYGGMATAIGLPINLAIAGVYILFGYFACRRARWAFILGVVFYSMDTLFVLAVKEWLMVAFHAFALHCIWKGLKADSLARQVEAGRQQMAPQA